METRVLKSLPLVKEIRQKLAERVSQLQTNGVTPHLVVILIGEDPASQIYVSNKKKACEKVGIHETTIRLESGATQKEVLEIIKGLNEDPEVHGFFIQSPVPEQLDISELQKAIDPRKDVDGFHPLNVGGLWLDSDEAFVPCTPLGVIEILKWAGIELAGKNAVIIGRSAIVGKPMAALLLKENCTVTTAHSRTKDLASVCRGADLLVSAVGRLNTVTKDMVKEGAILVDVGINPVPEGDERGRKIAGDMDFEALQGHVSAITPVPGGIGPMTIAMLLKNTVKAAENSLN